MTRSRREVVVDADREHARVRIAAGKDLQPLAGDERVRKDRPRGCCRSAILVARQLTSSTTPHESPDLTTSPTSKLSSRCRAMPENRLPERVLQCEAEDRGEERAAAEERAEVVVEDRGEEGAEEEDVEDERDHVAQERRGGDAAPGAPSRGRRRRGQKADDEEDQRDVRRELEKREVLAEDVAEVAKAREEARIVLEETCRSRRARCSRGSGKRIGSGPSNALLDASGTARPHDASDVAHANDQVDDPDAGDEAAHERVVSPKRDGDVVVEDRIQRPDAGPRDDREENTCLDAVEGEEKRNGHAAIVIASGYRLSVVGCRENREPTTDNWVSS